MDAVAGHDIGPTAENPGGSLLHVHQFEKAELPLFIVEEEVDVGLIARLVARRRAEEVKMLHTEPLDGPAAGLWLRRVSCGYP